MLYDSLPEGVMLEVAFDGADEVDDDLNCVKGGGACLFQEKLVAMRAKKFVCVAGMMLMLYLLTIFFLPSNFNLLLKVKSHLCSQ